LTTKIVAPIIKATAQKIPTAIKAQPQTGTAGEEDSDDSPSTRWFPLNHLFATDFSSNLLQILKVTFSKIS